MISKYSPAVVTSVDGRSVLDDIVVPVGHGVMGVAVVADDDALVDVVFVATVAEKVT